MKERAVIKENTNWWQRGAGFLLMYAGFVSLISLPVGDELVAAAALIGGAWLWKDSKKQVPATS